MSIIIIIIIIILIIMTDDDDDDDDNISNILTTALIKHLHVHAALPWHLLVSELFQISGNFNINWILIS